MSNPHGILSLTEKEQWLITLALEAESLGMETTAQWLRMKVIALRPVWTPSKEERMGHPHVNPTDVFRHHRGSLPPTPQVLPRVEQHPKPAIRPDQTVA